MKLAWKIFCAAYCIVMVTVGAGGFALVQAASDSMADSRRDAVLTSNEYAGKMFYALAENGPYSAPDKTNSGSNRKNGGDGSNGAADNWQCAGDRVLSFRFLCRPAGFLPTGLDLCGHGRQAHPAGRYPGGFFRRAVLYRNPVRLLRRVRPERAVDAGLPYHRRRRRAAERRRPVGAFPRGYVSAAPSVPGGQSGGGRGL